MAVDRILMIVSDTVRTDMLGYNGGGVRTPNLDRLAAKSMVFDRYYASSFPTVPARYDYLTGKPAFAGVGWGALPRTDRSIATTLTERATRRSAWWTRRSIRSTAIHMIAASTSSTT
jgi:arylsulfatase A-like enzyme